MIAFLPRDAMWIAATLLIFFACRALYLRRPHAARHPVVLATVVLVVLLLVTGYPLHAFQAGTRPLVWLLGQPL